MPENGASGAGPPTLKQERYQTWGSSVLRSHPKRERLAVRDAGRLRDRCGTTKNTYIAERHRRLQRRRGRKRAKVAISRTILESAWWVMSNDVDYDDLGPEHFLTQARNPARRAHRLTLELRALGYDIALPAPSPRPRQEAPGVATSPIFN